MKHNVSEMILTREAKIQFLTFMVVAGFAASVVFHYYLGQYLGWPYPYTTFLFLPTVHFSDYYQVIQDARTLNPYFGLHSAQYPFLIILGYAFSLIPAYGHAIYALLVTGLFLVVSVVYLRLDKWYASLTPIFGITLLSYPYLAAMDRGNFEFVVFVLLLGFLYLFDRERYLLSALVLALAIATKVYPAILVLLFLPIKKYREIAVCVLTAGLVTLGSLLGFSGGPLPNLQYLLTASNLGVNPIFRMFASVQYAFVQRGVSLLTLIKLTYFSGGWLPGFAYDHFETTYLALAGVLGIMVCLYVVLVEKTAWKRMCLLIFAMLVLPPISADYKLLHVFLPLYLFINYKGWSRLDAVYLLLFGILLIPKDYYFFGTVATDSRTQDASIGITINILVMVAMSITIVLSGLRARRTGEELPSPQSSA